MTALPEITWHPGIELKFSFFGKDNAERLTHDSVEDYLGDLDQGELDEADEDGVIRVAAYNRDMPTHGELEFLDDLMERVNETRTDPDGTWQDNFVAGGLEKIEAAQKAFIDVFLDNYEPWGCERAATILVPVDEYLKHTGEK